MRPPCINITDYISGKKHDFLLPPIQGWLVWLACRWTRSFPSCLGQGSLCPQVLPKKPIIFVIENILKNHRVQTQLGWWGTERAFLFTMPFRLLAHVANKLSVYSHTIQWCILLLLSFYELFQWNWGFCSDILVMSSLTLEPGAVRSLSPSCWCPLYCPREKTVHSSTNLFSEKNLPIWEWSHSTWAVAILRSSGHTCKNLPTWAGVL